MKLSSVFILAGVIAVGLTVYFSISGGPSEEEYAATLITERKEKDRFMKVDELSPFWENTDSFKELNYFPPDMRYSLLAALDPIADKQARVLATSTGDVSNYLEYAWASFDLDGTEHKLLILEIMDMGPNRGKLFLAFADATSAAETYGGGRFLDLKKVPAAASIELDFNRAYNPYCAYNDQYSCPFPPKENVLQVAIRAGEKTYK